MPAVIMPTGRARRFPDIVPLRPPLLRFPYGRIVAAPGQWSAVPGRTLPADRFPVHGSRIRVSCPCPAAPGSLRALVNLSDIGAPVPVQRFPVNGQRLRVGHCLRIGSPSTVSRFRVSCVGLCQSATCPTLAGSGNTEPGFFSAMRVFLEYGFSGRVKAHFLDVYGNG